jgi:hypothetical protein
VTEKRELLLDLLARDKTEAATKSAAKNLDDVGDAADGASKSTEKFGKSNVIAGQETEKLGKKADENAGRISKLKGEIKLTERELQSLARSFADTDDAAERIDLSKGVRRLENDLRRLNKNKSLLESILPDPDPEVSRSWSKKILGGIASGLSSGGDAVGKLAGNHVGITIGAAAGVAAAPVLVGTLATALSAAAGGIGIGAGIALAVSRDPEIQMAGKAAGKRFTEAIGAGAQAAFSGPVKQSIDVLSGAGDEIAARWTKTFAALGPSVVPLARDLSASFTRISDSLAGVAEDSAPALQGLGTSIRLVSDGVGDFLDTVSDGSPEAAANLVLVAGATADVVRQTGNFLNVINQAGANPWLTGPLLPLLRKHYEDAGAAGGVFVTRTKEATEAMTDAANAAFVEGNALTNLADDMRAQTDPVFGLLDAEDRLTEAQAAATKAAKEHGKGSKEADAALRELAKAAVEVEGKAGELALTSDGQLTPALRATLSAAGLTKTQINELAGQFRGAKRDGDNFSKTYKAKIEANTATAEARIKHVRDLLDKVRSKQISVSVLVADSQLNKANNTLDRFGGARAGGGPVKKNKAYIVGDGGRPEVFVPDEDGKIIPSVDQFTRGASAARGGGSSAGAVGQVDVLVRAAPNAGRDLVGQLVEALQYECRTNYGKSAQRMLAGD